MSSTTSTHTQNSATLFSVLTTMDYIYTIIGACRMAELHQMELLKFCRVCGKRLSRNRVSFRCQNHADKLATTFGLQISDDSTAVHPPLMCHPCYSVLQRSKKAADSGRQFHHSVDLFDWTPHSPSQCVVCEHFERVSSGGRPKKTPSTGRPSALSVRAAIDHIRAVAPPSFFSSHSVLRNDDSPCPDLLCGLCSKLLVQPVQLTTCNSLVCMACLSQRLEESHELVCPCCSSDHVREFSTIISPSPVVLTILGNQTFTCTLCKNKITAGIIIHLYVHRLYIYNNTINNCKQQI